MSRFAAIVTAAGSGIRLGAAAPKALVPIGGVPMAIRAARLFNGMPTVITAPEGFDEHVRELLDEHGIDATVVVGGATRAESVLEGLRALPADIDTVLVHDAARCLTPADVISRVMEGAARHGAAVPVVAVTDTLRKADVELLGDVVDRSELVAVQTPQGFNRVLLQRAFDAATERGDLAMATDESSLIAALGESVIRVDGDSANIKVTTPADLSVANERCTGVARTGIGVDAHAFDAESRGPLALAALLWQDVPALAGHSDGDVACHSLCDALFAAAMLGDLGSQFGVDDPQWAGATGARMLAEAVARVHDAGWSPVSASVQVIGNLPKIGPRRGEAEAALSAILGVAVTISGTTTDGLGMTGAGEGLAAVAVASVRRREQ